MYLLYVKMFNLYTDRMCVSFYVYCNNLFCVNNIVALKVNIPKSSHFEDTMS